MAKPRLTSEERKEQILENASKIFATHGLMGARTRDIAEICGINEALLYKHFNSKEELFRESLQYVHYRSTNELLTLINREANGLNQLRAVLKFQKKSIVENPQLGANILHGVASSTQNEEMRAWIRDWMRMQDDFVRMFVQVGISDGSIKPDTDVEGTVWAIRGASMAGTMASILGMIRTSPEPFIEDLFERIVKSIATEDYS